MAPALSNRDYAHGLLRAFGGAVLFGFPLLMTMEMWRLGFTMAPERLALFVLLAVPLLFGLSYYAGFRKTYGPMNDALDALAALAVGFAAAAVLLFLFGVIQPGASVEETVGKLSIQAVPAAIGALLARKQLAAEGDASSDGPEDEENRREGYVSELFLMAAGALFLSFNVAPTEEVVLIAYQMSPLLAALLAIASIALLHAIVYSLGFAGQHRHEGHADAFLHFTVPGYALVLLMCLYVEWTFGHADGQSLGGLAMTTVVLAFPGALGAGAARLLV